MSRDQYTDTDDLEINGKRRKLLSAIGATAGTSALAGTGVAAEDDDRELTEAELARALAEIEYVPVPKSHPAASDLDNTPHPSAMKEGTEVYAGEYKNAETPDQKAYEIQSFEEWQRQRAPTGFDRDRIDKDLGSEFFYLKEIEEDISLGPVTADKFGIGVGVQVQGSGMTNVEASLSMDIYVNRYSFAVSSFSIGYGPEEGLCLSPPLPTFIKVIPGLEVEFCIDGKIIDKGSELCVDIGGSASICADPCGGNLSCGYCKGLGMKFGEYCVDKPW